MGNAFEPKSKKIISLAEKVPYFTIDDLTPVESNRTYLKILLSRYEKKSKITRLKKGMYTTKEYVERTQKENTFSSYREFVANILSQPSYLSLEYILYQHNMLTELPVNLTSVSKNKTTTFSNPLGNFIYHKMKSDLFCGFYMVKEGNFTLAKATRVKALFDFLYLRKHTLLNNNTIEELRINRGTFRKEELKELEKYVTHEGSERMKRVFYYLDRKWRQ